MAQSHDPAPHEHYIYRANPVLAAAQGIRTAATDAAFFLPYLRPGMRLLDAGCGGGSITVGLGAVVAPGLVVGVDREERRLTEARGRAGAADVRVPLTAGDVDRLPFADASFDAVFAHHVLQHLRGVVRHDVSLFTPHPVPPLPAGVYQLQVFVSGRIEDGGRPSDGYLLSPLYRVTVLGPETASA